MSATVEMTFTCECCKKEEKLQTSVFFSRRGKGTFNSGELPGNWRTTTQMDRAFNGGDLTEVVVVCSDECMKKVW